jgi:hypothetical protein
VLLGLVAAGLFAFGAYQLVAAVYRRIDAPSLDEAGAKVKGQAEAAAEAVEHRLS